MRTIVFIVYVIILALFSFFSYGFNDPNLTLSSSPLVESIIRPLMHIAYQQRPLTVLFFILFYFVLWIWYVVQLRSRQNRIGDLKQVLFPLLMTGILLIFSYPALSYDLFNYITTAKLTFFHHENPYVVMPIDIPNDPYLAFTRAANKYALYGPIWILFTFLPFFIGSNNLWLTIIAFKFMNLLIYGLFVYLLYQSTKSIKNVLFFAYNPLVIIETMVSGHNDLFMMLLVMTGIIFWFQKPISKRIIGLLSIMLSIFTKGASVVITPLLFFKLSLERFLLYSYILFAIAFFIAAPIREELYPWYAIWLVAIVSFLPIKKYRRLYIFTGVLTFALELRHIPYMWMGYYEGPGPLLRFVFTAIPITIFFFWVLYKKLCSRYE